MWRVLFYVTPVTISVAILLLFVFALIIASMARHSTESPPRHMWKFLAAATAAYMLVLAMPPSGEIQFSTSRLVHWNPLHFMDELAAQGEIEESFGQYLTDGGTAHYSIEELSEQERADIQQATPTDFFAYGDPDQEVSVVDSDGNPVAENQGRYVISELSVGIEAAGKPIQYQSMILEEKALNALLFVPLGILSYFSFSSWWARASFGPAVSVAIEAIQWTTGMGNVADTADVLANSSGHVVGVGLAAAASGLFALRSPDLRGQPESFS